MVITVFTGVTLFIPAPAISFGQYFGRNAMP
jgi:hypothetical protein